MPFPSNDCDVKLIGGEEKNTPARAPRVRFMSEDVSVVQKAIEPMNCLNTEAIGKSYERGHPRPKREGKRTRLWTRTPLTTGQTLNRKQPNHGAEQSTLRIHLIVLRRPEMRSTG